jgi:iron complex outermembrane receptor protein
MNYTNNGAILPPYVSHQYEVGAKATVAENLLVTLALFDIDKANQYAINNGNMTYTVAQSGREVHKGIELTATGKLTSDLTLFGGLTFMDPRLTNNPASPIQDGQMPSGVSRASVKLYAEYILPFARDIALTGGVQAASAYYANLPNTQKVPGFVVGDIGIRVDAKICDHPFIFRVNVANVANTAYWQFYTNEGLPRTVTATAEMKF